MESRLYVPTGNLEKIVYIQRKMIFLKQINKWTPQKRQQHANMQCISWTGYNLWFYGLRGLSRSLNKNVALFSR